MSRMPTQISLQLVRQMGLSLVELMISVTLSLVIMAGVIQLYVSSTQTASTAEGASRIQENIRYTINHLGNNIARAGNMGCFSFSAVPAPASVGTNLQINAEDEIDKSIFNLLETRLEVWVDPSKPLSTDPSDVIVVSPNDPLVNVGADDTAWFDFENSFISGDDQNSAGDAAVLVNTDTFIVKFADSSAALPVASAVDNTVVLVGDDSNLDNGDLVLLGNCRRASVFTLSNADDNNSIVTINDSNAEGLVHGFSGTDPMLFLYAGESGSHRYFIGGTDCADNGVGRTNCSLFRSINGGNAQELVQGVHGMQVQYYDDENIWRDTVANDRRTIDRVQITLNFNALDGGNVLTKDITHVFAVRNQL